MAGERGALRAELLELMEAGPARTLPEEALNELALRTFRHQFASNLPYAAWCRRRDRTPGTVAHWTDIPAVPTAAFKELPLVSGDPAAAVAVFRTSGTTRGSERRGEHHVLDLALYHASLLATFRWFVAPDGQQLRLLSLVPPPEDLPDSSLAHMIAVLIADLGAAGSGHYATREGGIDGAGLEAALRRAEAESAPVGLLGTSLSFVHWLDALARGGASFRLPAGSRLMDTGGYKGRGREVAPAEMWAGYEERLGVPASHCVNEYGMTELCSQLYDTVLRDALASRGPAPMPAELPATAGAPRDASARAPMAPHARRKAGPPWLRTVVVDPDTLEPLPEGRIGLLRHLDLANLDSVAAVQTEDLGRAVPDGVELLGRVTRAPPRGCSIAMDDLLAAARPERR